MLWAIFRIYKAIKETAGISDLFDQKMIVFHIVTFVMYIVSIFITYVFYYFYSTTQYTSFTQAFYISWTFAVFLLACAQVILIYIFWGLNRQSNDYEEVEDAEVDVSGDGVHAEYLDSEEQRSSTKEDAPQRTDTKDSFDYEHPSQKFIIDRSGTEVDESEDGSHNSSESDMERQLRKTSLQKQFTQNVE